MQNIWIIIWRFNPLHIWHISLINSCIKSCDKTLIILWSANKNDYLNPFSISERTEFFKNEFWDNVSIEYLDDYESDEIWIANLHKIITNYCSLNDRVVFYCGDIENDSAVSVIKKNIKLFNFKKLEFVEKKRSEIPISATKIREYLKNWQKNILKKWLNKNVFDFLMSKK